MIDPKLQGAIDALMEAIKAIEDCPCPREMAVADALGGLGIHCDAAMAILKTMATGQATEPTRRKVLVYDVSPTSPTTRIAIPVAKIRSVSQSPPNKEGAPVTYITYGDGKCSYAYYVQAAFADVVRAIAEAL